MKNKILFSWTVVFLYTLLIFITLPVLPGVWRVLFARFKNVGMYIDIMYLMTAAGIFIYLVLKRVKPITFIVLFLLAGVSTYLLKTTVAASEKVHLIEYSLLGYFILYALRQHKPPKLIYLKAAALAIIISCLDEYIQHLLPNRIGEIRDVFMNIVFSIVGLGLMRIFEITRKDSI